MYDSNDSTKSPAWGMATVCEPGYMSQVGRVREVECAWISVFLQGKTVFRNVVEF